MDRLEVLADIIKERGVGDHELEPLMVDPDFMRGLIRRAFSFKPGAAVYLNLYRRAQRLHKFYGAPMFHPSRNEVVTLDDETVQANQEREATKRAATVAKAQSELRQANARAKVEAISGVVKAAVAEAVAAIPKPEPAVIEKAAPVEEPCACTVIERDVLWKDGQVVEAFEWRSPATTIEYKTEALRLVSKMPQDETTMALRSCMEAFVPSDDRLTKVERIGFAARLAPMYEAVNECNAFYKVIHRDGDSITGSTAEPIFMNHIPPPAEGNG